MVGIKVIATSLFAVLAAAAPLAQAPPADSVSLGPVTSVPAIEGPPAFPAPEGPPAGPEVPPTPPAELGKLILY